MGIVWLILLGFALGASASRIVPGMGVGVGIGIAGAVVGGYVGQALGVGSVAALELPILAFGALGGALLLLAQRGLAGRET
jgi:uncharacterized membrane protein YeaQ/YmgE (transglycosylase-associated protein family)